MRIFKNGIDGGKSKQYVLNHMKKCRRLHPNMNQRLILLDKCLEKENEEYRKKLRKITHLNGNKQGKDEFTKCGININCFELITTNDKTKTNCNFCLKNQQLLQERPINGM